MAIQYLKQAAKTPESETATARGVVAEMLAAIERRGEPAVREYAAKLDGWQGEILVTPEEVERRTRDIPQSVKRDIEFATEQVRRFALAQAASMREFSTELAPGVLAGQRLIPVNVAGC
jgi:sulfopropanediol 3-dehydrogenase